MSLPRRHFLSLLASTPALAMSPSLAADNALPEMPHVPWSHHAAIYQVNVRQYSADGTLEAAMAELPRLKAMGVDILWLMPIQPIGQARRNRRAARQRAHAGAVCVADRGRMSPHDRPMQRGTCLMNPHGRPKGELTAAHGAELVS